VNARDEVLGRIRTALGSAPAQVEVPRHYRRTRAGGSATDLFHERLVDYKATVVPTTEPSATLESVLERAGRIVVPPGLPWSLPGAVVDTGLTPTELDAFDTVVTGCAAACAETGTIVLDASPDQGRRAITLVPDRHVCVVRADQVVRTVPELLAGLDPRRPLTFISGPSATSDIELQRVEGVHGPRTLIVILVAAP
jgi:L-lactate dehydrogenase complex protein LldG